MVERVNAVSDENKSANALTDEDIEEVSGGGRITDYFKIKCPSHQVTEAQFPEKICNKCPYFTYQYEKDPIAECGIYYVFCAHFMKKEYKRANWWNFDVTGVIK
jgi:hypothetical protein